jgi:hypothetical protein
MTATAAVSTGAVANELVALCRQGRNLEAIAKLYHPKIVSIEPVGNEAMPAELTGMEAIREKNESWLDSHEVHSAQVNGPFVGGDQFAVHYVFDTTFKASGERSTMAEMALYTVKDGKIVREQFFYHAPGAQS